MERDFAGIVGLRCFEAYDRGALEDNLPHSSLFLCAFRRRRDGYALFCTDVLLFCLYVHSPLSMSLRGQLVCFCGAADIPLHSSNVSFTALGVRVSSEGGTVCTNLASGGVTLIVVCYASTKAVQRDGKLMGAVHHKVPTVWLDWLPTVLPGDSSSQPSPFYLPVSHRAAVHLLNTALSLAAVRFGLRGFIQLVHVVSKPPC